MNEEKKVKYGYEGCATCEPEILNILLFYRGTVLIFDDVIALESFSIGVSKCILQLKEHRGKR